MCYVCSAAGMLWRVAVLLSVAMILTNLLPGIRSVIIVIIMNHRTLVDI